MDAPTGASQTFSYSIPDGMSLAPGHMVRAPFGARTLSGVVFELSPSPQVEETRPVTETLYPEPVVDAAHIALARWISDYYICPLFDAVAPMLPPVGRFRPRAYLSLGEDVEDLEAAANSESQLRVLQTVERRGSVELERLVSALGEWARNSVSSLVSRGALVRQYRVSAPTAAPKYVESIRVVPASIEVAASWLSGGGNRAPRQSELLARLIESDAPLPAPDARREFGSGAVTALRRKGFVEIERERVFRDPLAERRFEALPPVALTGEQARAAEAVVATMRDASAHPRTTLLQGVTGSGKTEVYLAAVEECVAQGKQAIVMAPEIALTPQTVERFAGRFPGKVAVLHSGLAPGERHDQWWAIREGEYSVVVGSRSAVFAPTPNLGLIVMDEEHEWTYKQHDAQPRYHARDAAIELGRLTGAATLLGSASPDVASRYKGLRGEYGLSVLRNRVGRARDGSPTVVDLPTVEIVDMRRELREGNRGMFSRRLTEELEACLDVGRQAIVFLNRRGSATQMQCRNCGWSIRCGSCDVALTYHRPLERLVCHYCGRRRRMPQSCPQCLSFRLSLYGIGTQSVAAEVARRFPQARVMRWDRDAARYAREFDELMSRFRNGDADVIVGTQMVAKGLHLPGVALVGVALADVGLGIPDYRSGERTFQLLCQVAGRAGREAADGVAIFQTYQPRNYAIRAAAEQDYEAFYESEMRYRRAHGNPPYSRLIRLVYGNTNIATAEARAMELGKALRTALRESDLAGVEVLGPTPPYPSRLRGRYRWHIALRGRNPRALLDMITVPRGWVVDVDPVALT